MARISLHPVGGELSGVVGPHDAEKRAAHQRGLAAALAEKVEVVHGGWGPEYVERVHQKGKLTAWERVRALADEGSPVLEVGTLVNWGREFKGSQRPAPGAGVTMTRSRPISSIRQVEAPSMKVWPARAS